MLIQDHDIEIAFQSILRRSSNPPPSRRGPKMRMIVHLLREWVAERAVGFEAHAYEAINIEAGTAVEVSGFAEWAALVEAETRWTLNSDDWELGSCTVLPGMVKSRAHERDGERYRFIEHRTVVVLRRSPLSLELPVAAE